MIRWLTNINRNLLGWVSYSWAAEPFVVSAVGTYVPILLEQVARDNAVWAEDHSIACQDIQYRPDPTDPSTPGGVPGGVPGELPRCVVPFLGKYVDTSSLALYTFSLSVLLQTLVVITISGIADKGHHRKRLLVWFAVIGALTTCLFLFVGKHYYFASSLAVVSNASFGAVTVCGNAFLPVLVKDMASSKNVQNLHYSPINGDQDTDDSIETATQRSAQNSTHQSSVQGSNTPIIGEELLGTEILPGSSDIRSLNYEAAKVSGLGVAIGYFAALIVQILTMVLIVVTGSSERSLRLAISFVGVWWLVFQAPVMRFLQLDISEPSTSSLDSTKGTSAIKLLGNGWLTLYATIKEARKLKDVALFLAGWFIVSDAATTINSAAVLFARVELQMSAPSLAVIGMLTVFSGISGATLVPRIQPKLGKNPVNAILFVIAIGTLIPLYGILGFYFPHFGLNSPGEMYLLAAVYGFVLGGLNSTARSVFGTMIPSGKETMFFALFSVTDKGSSIIGPAITGIITDHTHNIRYTFYFLLIVMLIPLPIFSLIDVDRGQEEAEYLSEL